MSTYRLYVDCLFSTREQIVRGSVSWLPSTSDTGVPSAWRGERTGRSRPARLRPPSRLARERFMPVKR